MDIFQNTWFIGISTGIISGVLVFFLTKWIMDKRGKTEYYNQVQNANYNVINSLKPYIADQGLPSTDIFEALISSTARTFGIDEQDMYSVNIYCEELIREIINDVYVSNEKKQEYTNLLAEYRKQIIESKESINELKDTERIGIYAEKMSRKLSIYVSTVTAILGTVCSLLVLIIPEKDTTVSFWAPFNDNPIIWIPILLFLIVALIFVSVITFEMFLKTIKRHNESSNIQKGED